MDSNSFLQLLFILLILESLLKPMKELVKKSEVIDSIGDIMLDRVSRWYTESSEGYLPLCQVRYFTPVFKSFGIAEDNLIMYSVFFSHVSLTVKMVWRFDKHVRRFVVHRNMHCNSWRYVSKCKTKRFYEGEQFRSSTYK